MGLVGARWAAFTAKTPPKSNIANGRRALHDPSDAGPACWEPVITDIDQLFEAVLRLRPSAPLLSRRSSSAEKPCLPYRVNRLRMSTASPARASTSWGHQTTRNA